MRKVWVLFKKEFKETIRDKSVIFSNFLIPLFSLPLFIVVVSIAASIASMQESLREYNVSYNADTPKEILQKIKKFKRTNVVQWDIELDLKKESLKNPEVKKDILKLLNQQKVDVLVYTKKNKGNLEVSLVVD